jgi:DNA-binding response OmpR family regulator
VFELDPRAGELRKKGMKIRLQGQPVGILVMLLQHSGETITREELQKKCANVVTTREAHEGLIRLARIRGNVELLYRLTEVMTCL